MNSKIDIFIQNSALFNSSRSNQKKQIYVRSILNGLTKEEIVRQYRIPKKHLSGLEHLLKKQLGLSDVSLVRAELFKLAGIYEN